MSEQENTVRTATELAEKARELLATIDQENNDTGGQKLNSATLQKIKELVPEAHQETLESSMKWLERTAGCEK